MKINKQLFEDVLSGKLKGTFVLRTGEKISSCSLERSHCSEVFIYTLKTLLTYTEFGRYYRNPGEESKLDIVDFIPDIIMKENELTIEIPNNKVVDWEESKKQNKIILKDKQLTYEDICKKLFKENVYYINVCGGIELSNTGCITDPNNASTEHQLECILAKNQLATVAKYLNDGCDLNEDKYYVIVYCKDSNKPYVEVIFKCSVTYGLIIFKTKELAQQAIEILGGETVRLALEPLGI